jgi:tryptophan-rich sensory protein
MSYVNSVPMSFSGYAAPTYVSRVPMSFSGYNADLPELAFEGGEAPAPPLSPSPPQKVRTTPKLSLPEPAQEPMRPLMKSIFGNLTFESCKQAPWQPPKPVFMYAWAFLYTLYGTILVKTWRSHSSRNSLLWGLALNILWIPAFMRDPTYGLIVLGIMIGVAFDTSRRLELDGYHFENNWFYTYIAWLIFAFTLNLYIVANCKKEGSMSIPR